MEAFTPNAETVTAKACAEFGTLALCDDLMPASLRVCDAVGPVARHFTGARLDRRSGLCRARRGVAFACIQESCTWLSLFPRHAALHDIRRGV